MACCGYSWFFFSGIGLTSASQEALVVKNPPADAGDTRDAGSIPGLGRSPGGGRGHPLQHPCLEHPSDRAAWRAAVHGFQRVGHACSDSARTWPASATGSPLCGRRAPEDRPWGAGRGCRRAQRWAYHRLWSHRPSPAVCFVQTSPATHGPDSWARGRGLGWALHQAPA